MVSHVHIIPYTYADYNTLSGRYPCGLNTGLETKIISKDTYREEITVPGGSTIVRTITVGNDTDYRMRSISLYCSDNYIVPHLVSWERSTDSTSYAITVALHNLYKDSRTASKYGAITLHIK